MVLLLSVLSLSIFMRHNLKSQKLSLRAPIAEIFSSFQGEGLFIGQPQVFVRFSGCNLRCRYCDTPRTQTILPDIAYRSLAAIIDRVGAASRQGPKPRMVSLTGGEPLLYATFLKSLLPALRKMKLSTYLETNGTMPEALAPLIRWIDSVSMDIKLPSACGQAFWKEHREFLEAAGKKAFVKLVITDATTMDEVRRSVKVMQNVSKEIPLVLQPVTLCESARNADPARLYSFLAYARAKLSRVYLTPQMHKIWNVR
jgi:organic radical activating enzyme